VVNAAWIPSLVIGQVMMIGRRPCSTTNRSIFRMASREATVEPRSRMPFAISGRMGVSTD
jgi:hypothetical protein